MDNKKTDSTHKKKTENNSVLTQSSNKTNQIQTPKNNEKTCQDKTTEDQKTLYDVECYPAESTKKKCGGNFEE